MINAEEQELMQVGQVPGRISLIVAVTSIAIAWFLPNAGMPCFGVTEPYFFTTVAGEIGYGSADGTNAAARFHYPQGVATDALGNMYIADTFNHTIRKVSVVGTNWVCTTLAGSAGERGSQDGTNTEARFLLPIGIVADSTGNLYVSDSWNHTIRQITAYGTNWVVKTIAGVAGSSGGDDGTNANARFSYPEGLARDGLGNLFVADKGNHTIRRMGSVSGEWVITTLAGTPGASGSADGLSWDARFNSPEGVAADTNGNVFVADTLNNTFRMINPAGLVSTIAGVAGGYGSADGFGWGARFNYPRAVCVDSSGTLIIADTGNSTVRRIAPSGTNWMVTTLAGTPLLSGKKDGTNNAAQFASPCGIAIHTSGNLYIADSGNANLRIVARVGQEWVVNTLAGKAGYGADDGTNATASFNFLCGIASDYKGTFYVSDTGNNTIRKMVLQGSDYVVTTIAGDPVRGATTSLTDGTNTASRFSQPQGMVLDSVGNLYVADSMNGAIRKLTYIGTNWVTSTLASGFSHPVGFSYPVAVALDSAEDLYVADSANHTVDKLRHVGTNWVKSTIAGLAKTSGTADGTNSSARFNLPNGLVVDPEGNVFVADYFNNAIRQVTPVGTNWLVSTIAGVAGPVGNTVDGTNNGALFNGPLGVAMDGYGNLYVSEVISLRKMTRQGTNWIVTTLTKTNPGFVEPNAIIANNAGQLYVTDTRNNVIRYGEPIPSLRSSLVGGQFILSWPGSASNYVLQMSQTVDTSVWTAVTNESTIAGGNVFVTDQVLSASQFYRLKRR